MDPSILWQRLADINASSFEAISSDSHRSHLHSMWKCIEKDLESTQLSKQESRLLLQSSHNNNVMARLMVNSENLLQNMLKDAEAFRRTSEFVSGSSSMQNSLIFARGLSQKPDWNQERMGSVPNKTTLSRPLQLDLSISAIFGHA
jgi:hypothetical protein